MDSWAGLLLLPTALLLVWMFDGLKRRLAATAPAVPGRDGPRHGLAAALLGLGVFGVLLGTGLDGGQSLLALLLLAALASGIDRLRHWDRHRRLPRGEALVERIDALLPQTQCGQCGYPGCLPYARAIAAGEAQINQCPPGGQAGIEALARLLLRDPLPLSAAHGVEKPAQVARIREDECIGCFKCIAACPVAAIVGAPKHLHVVVEDLCTGCELCLPPCPVDCIDLLPQPEPASGRGFFSPASIRRSSRLPGGGNGQVE